eukprot:scaffold79412_cov66-Phaeocystis_antarctica.AAC.8
MRRATRTAQSHTYLHLWRYDRSTGATPGTGSSDPRAETYVCLVSTTAAQLFTSACAPRAPTPAASGCRPRGSDPSRYARSSAWGRRGTRRAPGSQSRSGQCGRGPWSP